MSRALIVSMADQLAARLADAVREARAEFGMADNLATTCTHAYEASYNYWLPSYHYAINVLVPAVAVDGVCPAMLMLAVEARWRVLFVRHMSMHLGHLTPSACAELLAEAIESISATKPYGECYIYDEEVAQNG